MWAARPSSDWRTHLSPNAGAPVAATSPTTPLPLPTRSERGLERGRALAASGRLHDALAALDEVRVTDPQKADADQLRAYIQRQLLALHEGATIDQTFSHVLQAMQPSNLAVPAKP
jgi:hypothetical protein